MQHFADLMPIHALTADEHSIKDGKIGMGEHFSIAHGNLMP
jgi:hypothetical protein